MRLLILAGHGTSLMLFRGDLIRSFLADGWEVHAAATFHDAWVQEALSSMGVYSHELPVEARGLNVVSDLIYARLLKSLFRKVRPDVLLAYTAKPVIYGGLLGRWQRVPRRVALITGLGDHFLQRGWSGILRRAVVGCLYRLSMPGYGAVMFQNATDLSTFLGRGWISKGGLATLLPGSGVNLDAYRPFPLPSAPRFVMVARLLAAKGVVEYLEAAACIRVEYADVQFDLVGPIAVGPQGVPESVIAEYVSKGIVNYTGPVRDVRPHLARASVFVLPSYYGEGQPRSMLEAMAMGRAVIAADAPGTREPVMDGITGLLVPPQDAGVLAQAMRRLIADPSLVVDMGKAARLRAVAEYDVNLVNQKIRHAIEEP
jgi:glycosyltransferase involved in cell wall biosynthesis